MQTCVIMHTIIIENDHMTRARHVDPYECQRPLAEIDHQVPTKFSNFLFMHTKIHDSIVHARLQYDLREHLWRIKEYASCAPVP
jgi:hypothetical protein